MRRLTLTIFLIIITAGQSWAMWQLYNDDPAVIAQYDYDSFAPFRGQPSVWVKWQYATPKDGLGGVKLQFTADCAANKLYEISSVPFDADGNYLAANELFNTPKEYPVTPGSLNEASYKLLCH